MQAVVHFLRLLLAFYRKSQLMGHAHPWVVKEPALILSRSNSPGLRPVVNGVGVTWGRPLCAVVVARIEEPPVKDSKVLPSAGEVCEQTGPRRLDGVSTTRKTVRQRRDHLSQQWMVRFSAVFFLLAP